MSTLTEAKAVLLNEFYYATGPLSLFTLEHYERGSDNEDGLTQNDFDQFLVDKQHNVWCRYCGKTNDQECEYCVDCAIGMEDE